MLTKTLKITTCRFVHVSTPVVSIKLKASWVLGTIWVGCVEYYGEHSKLRNITQMISPTPGVHILWHKFILTEFYISLDLTEYICHQIAKRCTCHWNRAYMKLGLDVFWCNWRHVRHLHSEDHFLICIFHFPPQHQDKQCHKADLYLDSDLITCCTTIAVIYLCSQKVRWKDKPMN